MSIEAMKLALEGLDEWSWGHDPRGADVYIDALRQAIEQAQQAEPVAYSYTSKITGAQGFSHHPLPRFTDAEHWDIVPLYITPPVATNDTTQERVAETSKNVHEPCGLECDCTDVCKQTNYKALWQQMCERCDELDKQLAKRQWVGLTPQERDEINEKVYGAVPHHVAFHHAIEARLKELNT